jgi:alpha/beta superfamily hydrolase
MVILVFASYSIASAFPSQNRSLSSWLNRHGPDTPGYPCAAADYVENKVPHTTGKILNEFSWGGYLAWRLQNQYQVLLDGRTQVYPAQLWQDTYLGSDSDREKFLATQTADAAVLPSGKSQFRPTLEKLGWTTAYTDDRSIVMLPPPSSVARIEP